MRKTNDPGVWIESEGPEWLIYNNGDRRWKVTGICNCCGLCEVGAVGRNLVWSKEPGEPYAEIDLDYGKRLDMVVTPQMKVNIPTCSLEFESL